MDGARFGHQLSHQLQRDEHRPDRTAVRHAALGDGSRRQGGYYRMGQAVGPEGPWEPVFDDPIFLAKLDRFLAAFAVRYDDKPWLRYVDIGSIGDWGEGHTWAGSRQECGFAAQVHVDLHLKHFKHAPLVVSDDFVYALSNPAERAALHQFLLTNGISYRDDSIIVDGYLQARATPSPCAVRSFSRMPFARRRRCSSWSTTAPSSAWQLGRAPDSSVATYGKGKTGPDYFRGALELLHATYIGYHGDAHEWLADNPELTKELLNRCGYWLFPVSLELPEKAVAGEKLPLALTIENRGVAPPYAPYELRAKLTGPGAPWVHTLATGCRAWMPGAP